MAAKSKILIIGGTGYIGKYIVEASAKSGHPTFALLRESTVSSPAKAEIIKSFKDSGVTIIHGDLYSHESLVKAIKQVDVVISTVGSRQLADQVKIIAAIKEAANVKRFFPSEFGVDPDKTRVSGLDNDYYSGKAKIRRLVEAEGIPYTYICCNICTSFLLPSLAQPGLKTPPRDKVTIFGDGNVKGVFVKEVDVAAFTISTVDDPRTLNKAMHLRPPGNVYSLNELVEIWESKIGKKLEKIYVSEEEFLKKIQETPYPANMEMVFIYSTFVKGDQTYFDIESSGGVEGTQLQAKRMIRDDGMELADLLVWNCFHHGS
ncbi:hypothetical protein F0562_020563 [Nyssa sinensis]|uniref:NmrA-like domain-containing protein n=1 Tax=Nyssa sinensis TaxID=561372 RepID=A0A5J5BTJ4_9ASTE|nr:hypothetical protein F0562_020563 [Nyssa sinensis]